MDPSQFFKALYQHSEGKIEIRPLPGKPGFYQIHDYAGIDSHCRRYAQSHLYFGVATRDGNGGGKQNIIGVPAVWCDVDYKDTSRESLKDRYHQLPFKPSTCVQSGGGVQLYWILNEPATPVEISKVEDVNHRLADLLGGDHNCCDAARVLRVPGTINHKYKDGRRAVLSLLESFRYDLDSFLEYLPQSSYKKIRTNAKVNAEGWLVEALRGVSRGRRDCTGAKIAGYFINKLSDKDVVTILSAWNYHNDPPLEESEIKKIVRSVGRYRKHGEPEIEKRISVHFG